MTGCHYQKARAPDMRLIIVALYLLCGTLAAHPETLTYPRPVSEIDRRSEYPLRLLMLALEKTGGGTALKPSELVMNKARVAAETANNRLDVGWMVTNREREESMLPVRICIFKGLGGWRIGLIRQGDEKRFETVKTPSDLRDFSVGQQADWPDTAILSGFGIPVVTTVEYDVLFKMLSVGRFDWFLRNIMEVWDEAEFSKDMGIAVEPKLLVRYPSAYYFFVNKSSAALASRIEKGLETALKDGSFDRLLIEYHGDVLAKAKIADRIILDIPNPYLPPLTPLKRKDLWYQPAMP